MRAMVSGETDEESGGEEGGEEEGEDGEEDKPEISFKNTVMVTGAEGFIAGHIIKALLIAGFRVVGTVRTLRNQAKHQHLLSIVPELQEEDPSVLRLVEADLGRSGTFDPHMELVEYVVHVASPFKLGVRDAKVGLITPAVQGTLQVLNAAQRCGHIKRVVMTSCTSALVEKPSNGRMYSENDWNEASSVESYPYHSSKTEAERAAYDFVKKLPADKRFDLVTILPSMVIGPLLAGENTTINTSIRIIQDMLKGLLPWIPKMGLALVDVRDVAKAHVQAIINPNANGRYVCHTDTLSFTQVCDIMRKNYERQKLPIKEKGKFMTRRSEPFIRSMAFQYIRPWLGKRPEFSNRRIVKDLGIDFIPIEKSVIDMMQSFKAFNM